MSKSHNMNLKAQAEVVLLLRLCYFTHPSITLIFFHLSKKLTVINKLSKQTSPIFTVGDAKNPSATGQSGEVNMKNK